MHMNKASVLLFTALTSAWPSSSTPSRAAYFLDNDPAGASVISLQIDNDGKLCSPVRHETGGYGGIEVNSTGARVGADSLGSQSSVVVAKNLLFAVNAGSSTLSMFRIDPQQPWDLTLVGKPQSTQGDFPVSVDYSPQLQQACVLNGGSNAGVSCFSVDSSHGLTPLGPLRKLSSVIISETNPPNGPPGAASQIGFNQDSTALFATIRGIPGSRNGSLLAWPVESHEVGTGAPVVSQFDNVPLDFGFSWISQSKMFLVDPSYGASLIHIKRDWSAVQEVHTSIPGQKAICWSAYDAGLHRAYAIDAGTNSVYVIDPVSGAHVGNVAASLPDGKAGIFDSAVQANLLYSLTGANGIVVLDLKKQEQIQYLDLSDFGIRQFYQGMAVWP